MRLRNPINIVSLRPQDWSRLKTLLLKHYCRRQEQRPKQICCDLLFQSLYFFSWFLSEMVASPETLSRKPPLAKCSRFVVQQKFPDTSLPCTAKTFPTEKICYPNYFLITVARFEIVRINFRKLPVTYCIRVSCATLPAWDPFPC